MYLHLLFISRLPNKSSRREKLKLGGKIIHWLLCKQISTNEIKYKNFEINKKKYPCYSFRLENRSNITIHCVSFKKKKLREKIASLKIRITIYSTNSLTIKNKCIQMLIHLILVGVYFIKSKLSHTYWLVHTFIWRAYDILNVE